MGRSYCDAIKGANPQHGCSVLNLINNEPSESTEQKNSGPAFPEGCMVTLIGFGFLCVFFIAGVIGAQSPADSEVDQGMRAFAGVALSAAIVLGLWGCLLLLRTKE